MTQSPDKSGAKAPAPKATSKPTSPTADTFANNSSQGQRIAAMYPGFGDLLNSNPEIASLLEEAAAGNWTPQELQAKLVGTQWWKSRSGSERQWEYTKLVDPAQATQQKNQTSLSILQSAAVQGVHLTLQQAAFLAEAAIGQGWDATRLQQEVAKLAQPGAGGTIGAQQTALRGLAADYGLNLSDAATFKWARDIADGFADEKGFTEYAKNQAIAMHPYWEKELSGGATVRQLADPYIQQASQLLEVNPDTIDLSNHKWDFTARNKAGEQQPMSQTAWAQKLMTDPTYGWSRTQNAQQAAYGLVDSIRQSFGAS